MRFKSGSFFLTNLALFCCLPSPSCTVVFYSSCKTLSFLVNSCPFLLALMQRNLGITVTNNANKWLSWTPFLKGSLARPSGEGHEMNNIKASLTPLQESGIPRLAIFKIAGAIRASFTASNIFSPSSDQWTFGASSKLQALHAELSGGLEQSKSLTPNLPKCVLYGYHGRSWLHGSCESGGAQSGPKRVLCSQVRITPVKVKDGF